MTLTARAAAVLVALSLARVAQAADDQDTEIAKRHFNYGKELYAAQRYDEAIVEFESARTARPLPAFDYNIARCHDRLEHLAEAIAAYRRFLAATADPRERAEPEARMKVLQARLAGPERKKPSLLPAIAVGGAAVVALTVGAILLGVTGHDFDDLHDSCAPLCARSAWSALPARADAGYALVTIGALAAAADVVLWVLARRPQKSERALSATGRGFGFAF